MLIYTVGLIFFGLIPYELLFVHFVVPGTKREFVVFTARIVLVCLFILLGWIITLATFSRTNQMVAVGPQSARRAMKQNCTTGCPDGADNYDASAGWQPVFRVPTLRVWNFVSLMEEDLNGSRAQSFAWLDGFRAGFAGLGGKHRLSRARVYFLTATIVCGIAIWRGEVSRRSLLPSFNKTPIAENEIDEALQRAATDALGQQEGTIIVVDPQTGRVRAVVNPRIAFENSYAPGSTIKPFTALAALRAGLIDKNSTTLCREHYSRKDFHTVCAHPRDLPPFNPSEAIAYSCNYYFGTLGERLNEELLSDTLSSFGFGKPAFADGDHNHAGQLLRGKGDPRNSLGEGDHLQATPIQLIMAYAALVNGGHLLAPRVAASSDFQVSERARLQIAPAHRAIVIEGMRGAVVYGTAARAGLNSSSMNVFGKTGTSTPAKGLSHAGLVRGLRRRAEQCAE